jgi:hypothetical protein
MADQPKWQISGDYFENCSCDVVCPCLVSTKAPLTSRPTRGACEVPAIFHIDKGKFGDVSLDGLNVALMIRTPGPMGEGNWTVAAYIDERANDRQAEALGAIFSGGAGGPMAAFAPLIANNLGVKRAAINYRVEGKRRTADIPNVMHMSVRPLPSAAGENAEIWGATGHPFNPDKLAFAVGEPGNVFHDHGMQWDNSGQNAHYASINWSN